jgi:hypothetical protein
LQGGINLLIQFLLAGSFDELFFDKLHPYSVRQFIYVIPKLVHGMVALGFLGVIES